MHQSDRPIEVITYTQSEYYVTRFTSDGTRMIVMALLALVLVMLLVRVIPEPPTYHPVQQRYSHK